MAQIKFIIMKCLETHNLDDLIDEITVTDEVLDLINEIRKQKDEKDAIKLFNDYVDKMVIEGMSILVKDKFKNRA